MGGFHTVTLPDGRSVDFPSTMGDAEINSAVQKIVGGAPKAPPAAEENIWKRVGRGAALGTAQGLGIPETQTPVSDFFKGFYGQAKDTLSRVGSEAQQYGIGGVPGAEAVRAIKGAGSGLYGAGKETVSGIEQKDPEQIAHGAASFGTQALMLRGLMKAPQALVEDFGKNLSESGRLLKQMDAINRGQVQVVNEFVRKPLATLDAKVTEEVGGHVKAAVDADRAHMAQTGTQVGLVNAVDAASAANAKLAKMGPIVFPMNLTSMIEEAQRPMTLNEAKSLTTDVGRAASTLTRQGNMRPASVMNELYEGLHKATQTRADELGTGKSWQQYINLHRSFMKLSSGLMGELVDEPVHAKAMGKLVDPERATEWNELRDELDKRGIDTASFEKAREYAQDMSRLVKTTGNMFFTKVKAIINHPFTAAPAAIAASEVGRYTGLPGLSFVLPMIAAGKVAGFLDMRQVTALLSEINKAVPSAEQARAREALPAPMSPQGPSPTSPPSPTPIDTAPKFKGGISSAGVEASSKPASLADQIQGLKTENYHLKEKMRVSGGTFAFTDEEVEQAESRMAENQKLIKELQKALDKRKSSGR